MKILYSQFIFSILNSHSHDFLSLHSLSSPTFSLISLLTFLIIQYNAKEITALDYNIIDERNKKFGSTTANHNQYYISSYKNFRKS